jgi:hypothetical protein
VGLVLGAVVALAVLAERRGNVPFALVDLAAGCSLLVAGVVTVWARGLLAGALLLAAAASWFVVTADVAGGLTDRLTYVSPWSLSPSSGRSIREGRSRWRGSR